MLPYRLILLHKRGHSDLLIATPKHPVENLPLVVQSLPQSHLLALIHNLLRTAYCHLRQPRNLLRCFQSPLYTFLHATKTPRSYSPPFRLDSTERLPRQYQLHRLRLAHRGRQPLASARSGNDP